MDPRTYFAERDALLERTRQWAQDVIDTVTPFYQQLKAMNVMSLQNIPATLITDEDRAWMIERSRRPEIVVAAAHNQIDDIWMLHDTDTWIPLAPLTTRQWHVMGYLLFGDRTCSIDFEHIPTKQCTTIIVTIHPMEKDPDYIDRCGRVVRQIEGTINVEGVGPSTYNNGNF